MTQRGALLVSILTLCAVEASAQDVVENTPRLCQNGTDDDGDGLADCDDPGCSQLIFCVGANEPTETEVCDDGDDNDGDGAVDCDDPDCDEACSRSIRIDGRPDPRGIYQPRVPDEPEPTMEYSEHDTSRNYPVAWAAHPITVRSGMLVPRASLSSQPIRTPGFGDETLIRLGLGATYGILDFWQVTLVAVPLRLSPVVDYENPALATTFQVFSIPELEIGIHANVGIPIGTASGSDFPEPLPRGSLQSRSRYYDVAHLELGLLARIHVEDIFRIDLQVPITAIVFSDDAMGDLSPRADLSFIGRMGFSITEYAFAGVSSGLFIQGPGYDAPRMPFFLFAGAVIPGWRRGPAAELALRFGWPVLYDGGAAMGVDPVDPDFWQLTFDVRIFSYLLN